MEIFEALRGKIQPTCLAERCRKGNCTVVFPPQEFPKRLLLNLDKLKPKIITPHCDFVLFGMRQVSRNLWVIPVEFKGGRVDGKEVVDQLQGGADFAKGLVGDYRHIVFRPTLVYGGRLDRDAVDVFSAKPVKMDDNLSRHIEYESRRIKFP